MQITNAKAKAGETIAAGLKIEELFDDGSVGVSILIDGLSIAFIEFKSLGDYQKQYQQ